MAIVPASLKKGRSCLSVTLDEHISGDENFNLLFFLALTVCFPVSTVAAEKCSENGRFKELPLVNIKMDAFCLAGKNADIGS